MKLKRLLSGVTAAVMALSAAAVASFSTASATDEEIVTENITSIEYAFTVTSGGNTTVTFTNQAIGWENATNGVIVTDSGDYTVTIPVNNATGMTNLGFIEVPEGQSLVITVNTIKVNDYVFTVGKSLDALEMNGNGLANIWNDDGKADVVYPTSGIGAYLAGRSSDSVGIRLVIGEAPATTDPTDSTDPTDGSYHAMLGFCDSDFIWDNRSGKSDGVEADKSFGTHDVTGSGEYRLGVNKDCVVAGREYESPTGITCLYVDIWDYATALGVSTKGKSLELEEAKKVAQDGGVTVTDLSIIVDGNTVYTYDNADILYGDLEGNGNLRIDLYNTYSGSSEIAPDAVKDLAMAGSPDMSPAESVEVSFKLKISDQPTSASTTAKITTTAKTTTTATTANAKAVQAAKDKAAAKKAMKQAKITKLTVKSKAKKKITVSWKKVKKAKGYQVQVSKKKNFKKNIVNKLTSKKKLTIKNSKIKSKKTYYVRVRAYATYKDANNKAIKVYSAWNKKLRKVKVK